MQAAVMFAGMKVYRFKKLVKQAQRRLKQAMIRRYTMARELRIDIRKLDELGHQEAAGILAEQLYQEKCRAEAYQLLECFCEIVISNLPCIVANKDCPADVNEAVSSLIFASMRCGDLPELRLIRLLFEEVYGHRFVQTAVGSLPGNVVHQLVKEKLSIGSVAESLKRALVDEARKESSNTLGIDRKLSDEDAQVELRTQYTPKYKYATLVTLAYAYTPRKP